MKRMYSFYLFKTIKSRLLAVSLTFLAIGIILPVQITTHIYLDQIQRKNEEGTVSKFMNTAMQINDILSSSMTSSILLQSKEETYDYLTTGYVNEDYRQKTLDRISFLNKIEYCFDTNSNINAVLFFRKDGTMCGASSTWNFFMEEGPHPFYRNRIQNLDNAEHSVVWLGVFPKTDFTLSPIFGYFSANDLMICGLRKFTYTLQPDIRKDFIMLVSVKEESIRDSFKYLADEYSDVCLLDASGALISGSDFSQFGVVPAYYNKINSRSQYGSVSYTTEQDMEYQLVYYRLENPDWILVKLTPTSIQYKSIYLLRNITLGVGSASIVLAGVLYSIWAIRFTRPLKQITLALTRVHEGDFAVQIPETSNIEEINKIQQHFNQMINSINDLLAQKEKNEQEKLLLEVRNLQVQINPHFIYNSITSIRWMATLSGAEKVSDMLVVLSELLHPIFSEWTLDWTLRDELSYADNYIKLMRLRYGNRVSMDIQKEITMATDSIKIPRFVLQPLLENSCEHGVLRDQSLHIEIHIYYDANKFIIQVMDDGAGFHHETMLRLNEIFAVPAAAQLTENSKEKGRGIGLINVNRRLKMRYGEGYGLTIMHLSDHGSCIEVKIGVKDLP